MDGLKQALVAEDNAALRRVIGFTLQKVGFQIASAADGLAAWREAEERAFDLVVTDQQMPVMTGLELIERLQGSDANRDTPVVLLTAKGLELDIDRVREKYRVAAMLAKPFSPAQLGALAEQLTATPA